MSLAVGDLDGDRHPDLVSANAGSNDLSVLINQGDGSFRLSENLRADGEAGAGGSVTAGDIDSDGDLDLVAADLVSDTVSVFLNLGAGVFDSALNTPVRPRSHGVILGDLDSDGFLDMLVSSFEHVNAQTRDVRGAVEVRLGLGDGAFIPGGEYTMQGLGTVSMALGDIDGDGDLDVVLSNRGNRQRGDRAVEVLTNSGEGDFSLSARYVPGGQAVALGDLDGDGAPDLVVTGHWDDRLLVVRKNLGGGTFGEATPFGGSGPGSSLGIGDVDGDGTRDLVVAGMDTEARGVVHVLPGLGDGRFSRARSFRAGVEPLAIVLGHFDGDDRLDAAMSDPRSHSISTLINHGGGDFDARASRYPTGGLPQSVAFGDLDQDGVPDIVSPNLPAGSNLESGHVSILIGLGDGAFEEAKPLAVDGRPSSIGVGDLSGDGIVDLAVTTREAVLISIGDGSGEFGRPLSYDAGPRPGRIQLADFDGDGLLDLAVANFDAGFVSVLLNSGGGEFRDPAAYEVGERPLALVSADLDRDGVLDLAVAVWGARFNGSEGALCVLLGEGDGRFGERSCYAQHAGGRLAVGDLDADGFPDVIVLEAPRTIEPNELRILLNRGDGTLRQITGHDLDVYSRSVAIGDVDEDGNADVVLASPTGANATVLLGRGDGTFASSFAYRLGGGASSVALEDLDNDGDLDVATANPSSGDISILLNRTRP